MNDLAPEQNKLPATQSLGRGHDAVSDQEDYEIPRAKLIQSTSEEATVEKDEDRIGIGKIINSMTKKQLPSKFIIVRKYPNSYIQWNPRKKDDPNFDPAYDAGALVFTTTDSNDPRVLSGKNFGLNGESPKVTKYLNFLAYFLGESWPVVVSFSKTSFAAGKKLNSLTRLAGGDIFSNQFVLKSVMRESAGTKFFIFDVAPAGKASENDFKVAEALWNQFKDRDITVHQVNEDESADATKKDPDGWKD